MATTWMKQAGLPIFPSVSNPTTDHLLGQILEQQPWRHQVSWPVGFEGGVTHRLDNDTSGAILLADDLEELQQIRGLFTDKQFRKFYRMYSHRNVPWNDNRCELALAHDAKKKNRMIVARGEHTPHRGKWYPAETSFRLIKPHLWEVEISTGVMHQIRAHAAFIGIPIAGDRIYGGGERLPELLGFALHHMGLKGPGGVSTQPVVIPDWAEG